MGYRVSVLDQTSTSSIDAPGVKTHKTVRLAKQADYFGFHRYFLGTDTLQSKENDLAGESLAESLLNNTISIHVSSISNIWLESAKEIAEKHRTLSRKSNRRADLVIDLIHPLFKCTVELGYGNTATELKNLLENVELSVSSFGSVGEKFLIGSGKDVATLAGQSGWTLIYPAHINCDAVRFRETLEAYHVASNGKIPVVALSMFADESERLAFQKTSELKNYDIFHSAGKLFCSALSIIDNDETNDVLIQNASNIRPALIAGTGVQICAELDRLESTFGIDEFLLVQPPLSNTDLVASLELVSLAPLSAIA